MTAAGLTRAWRARATGSTACDREPRRWALRCAWSRRRARAPASTCALRRRGDQLSCGPVTRVAIIEDRKEIREGLASLIGGAQGFECTGAYRSMEEAIDGITRDVP